MKALRLADFGRMEVVDLPNPEPGPGEVLIRAVATGVCGSDLHGFTGDNGRRVPGQVMGHESVGTVEGLGAGIEDLGVGDTVTFNPVVIPESDVEAFAEYEDASARPEPGFFVSLLPILTPVIRILTGPSGPRRPGSRPRG